MDKKPISRAGFDIIVKELKNLKEVERPAILEVVAAARALGDLSENAEYSSAREKQRNIDQQIRCFEDILSRAHIIDTSSLSGDKVVFGAHVIAEDENGSRLECQILSDVEADGKMIISCTSPVGRALVGKCVGDTCVVRTPGGEKEYEILEVKFNK